MFGKIKDFKVNESIIKIEFEKIETKINIINHSIINFFVPNFRKKQDSKAIENLEVQDCTYVVKRCTDNITIKTDELIIKIYDEFKVDIYNKNEKLICEDYRGIREPFIKNCAGRLDIATQEGHKANEHMEYKVFLPKKMEDNMYFYGFGERSGHLNKRYCHYINWNTDDPNPHGETYEKLYKSIPFFITLKDKESFWYIF